MTAKGGLFMVDVEVDCLIRRSAKPAREARITRSGCLHFLMQACRLIYYFLYFTYSIIIRNYIIKSITNIGLIN